MNKTQAKDARLPVIQQHNLVWSVLLIIFISFSSMAYDPMAPPGFERGDIDSSSLSSSKLVKKKLKKSDYILRQIIIRPTTRSAVINGYIVHEGSYLKGAKIEKIKVNTVELTVLGKRKVLTLEARLPRIRR